MESSTIPQLILYKFLFNFEFLEDAVLPDFKGSTVRGAFGWQLLKAVKGLYPVYEKIFETKEHNRYEAHPFILHPPITPKRKFVKGEIFTIGVTLIGYVHNFLPSFIEAFTFMGENGITPKKVKLRLMNVLNEDLYGTQLLVYEGTNKKMRKNYKEILSKDIIAVHNYDVDKINLKFLTPFTLREKGRDILEKDKDKITPNILTARLEGRYRTLAKLYCRSESDIKEIFRPDSSVTINTKDIVHFEMSRHSNREKKKQKFLGLSGSFTLEGNLESILPLIYIGEKINLGNKSSFGWGQYTVEPVHEIK